MDMTGRTTSNLRYGRLGLAAVQLWAAGCSRGNVQVAAPAKPAPRVTVVKATAQDASQSIWTRSAETRPSHTPGRRTHRRTAFSAR